MTVEYHLQDMTEWHSVGADFVLTDPPFGLDHDGKKSNYNRDESNVVDGYVEWGDDEYRAKVDWLLDTIARNLAESGQAVVFSGWQRSSTIHQACTDHDALDLEGKLYWSYNFAPYCTRRPAHNVYEVFWLVSDDDWYYDNECSYDHCQDGEGNLTVLDINQDYHKDMPKYPTRMAEDVVGVLLEHFTEPGDLVFDPLAGSGITGHVAAKKGRDAMLGDVNEEGKRVFEEIRDRDV